MSVPLFLDPPDDLVLKSAAVPWLSSDVCSALHCGESHCWNRLTLLPEDDSKISTCLFPLQDCLLLAGSRNVIGVLPIRPCFLALERTFLEPKRLSIRPLVLICRCASVPHAYAISLGNGAPLVHCSFNKVGSDCCGAGQGFSFPNWAL